jgi:hypothetical protein
MRGPERESGDKRARKSLEMKGPQRERESGDKRTRGRDSGDERTRERVLR